MATKIFYSPCYHPPGDNLDQPEGPTSIWAHPLHSDLVFKAPRKMLEYQEEDHIKHTYWDCPAWKSYWSNTWVVFNQLDVEIEYEKSSGSITSSNFRFDRINQSIMIAEGKLNTQGLRQNSSDIGMPYNGNLVFQLPQLLLFWLPNKDPNVWVEVLPYPSLFHETGLELISVEYPFSRWHKPVNPAFKAHSSKFKLRRGQPIYMVRFKSNKNNTYDLRQWQDPEPPEWIINKANKQAKLKRWLRNSSWDFIKDDKESKCPFKKFW